MFLNFVTWLALSVFAGGTGVPSFLSSMVDEASINQSESVVVLLRLEEGKDEHFFNKITREVMRNNAENSFVISKRREAMEDHLLRAVAFIIATMDSFDFVRNLK